MNLDDRIRAVLDREADGVETSWPPPLEDLLADGTDALHRRRARRGLVGAVGVFLLAATTMGGALLTGQEQQSHKDAPVVRKPGLWLEGLPAGAPPASLYCLDGVVRWGNQELTMADADCAWPDRFAQAGDTAVAVDSALSRLTLFVGDETHEPPGRVDAESSPVVLSPDGDIVGWVSAARVGGRQEIVLWDTTKDVEWKRVQAPTSDLLNLEGIDASGRVYLTSVRDGNQTPADRIWVWRSREDGGFRRVVGLGDFVTVADVAPDGLAVLKTVDDEGEASGGLGLSGIAVWGTVTKRGDFVLGPATKVHSVAWAPDRSRYLGIASLRVVEPAKPGDAGVKIRLPTDVQVAEEPSWESTDDVLVPVVAVGGSAVGGAVLRCSAETGRCEVAASGGQDLALPGGDADNLG